MKQNLKLLISSAIIVLTFSLPQEILGMEEFSNLAEQNPSRRQLIKKIDDTAEEEEQSSKLQEIEKQQKVTFWNSMIDTMIQQVKDLQNCQLTYGEFVNILGVMEEYYKEIGKCSTLEKVFGVHAKREGFTGGYSEWKMKMLVYQNGLRWGGYGAEKLEIVHRKGVDDFKKKIFGRMKKYQSLSGVPHLRMDEFGDIIDQTIQRIKDLQNYKLTYGELINALDAMEKQYEKGGMEQWRGVIMMQESGQSYRLWRYQRQERFAKNPVIAGRTMWIRVFVRDLKEKMKQYECLTNSLHLRRDEIGKIIQEDEQRQRDGREKAVLGGSRIETMIQQVKDLKNISTYRELLNILDMMTVYYDSLGEPDIMERYFENGDEICNAGGYAQWHANILFTVNNMQRGEFSLSVAEKRLLEGVCEILNKDIVMMKK